MHGRPRLLLPDAVSDSPGELSLRRGELELIGMSRASVVSAFTVRPCGVAVDMGRCSRLLARQETVLLTHCHSDHVAGLIAWLSARVRRFRGAPVRVAVPAERRGRLLAALESWPDLDVVRRRIDLAEVLVPVAPGDRMALPGGWARAFAVHHTTASLGWQIGESGRDRPRVVVAGDSTILPFRERPSLLDADLAVVECSFVEPGRRVAARLSGHAHLTEWLDLLPELPCDALVLAHLPEGLEVDRLRELLGELPDSGPVVVPWQAGPDRSHPIP
jgi:ribonuclease BN (tRNA processing enzyme)